MADVEADPTRVGRIKRLTFNQGIDTAPTWSPTGRQLAFVSDRGGTPQIYTMDAEGSNVQRISFGGSNWHDSPAWSPAGDRIVYVARVDNALRPLRPGQHVESASSRSSPRPTPGTNRPTWSPDGRHILFTSNMKGGIQIFTVDYDGANLRQLTTTGQNKFPPGRTERD